MDMGIWVKVEIETEISNNMSLCEIWPKNLFHVPLSNPYSLIPNFLYDFCLHTFSSYSSLLFSLTLLHQGQVTPAFPLRSSPVTLDPSGLPFPR